MAFLKYLGEDGQDVPRTDAGVPIRGPRVPFLRQEEMDDLPLSADVNARAFRTDDPEQLKAYIAVMDRIVNGVYERVAPDLEQVLPAADCWLFFVRWAEIKADVPKALYDRTGGYVR